MGMAIEVTTKENETTISITGDFTYTCHGEFREMVEKSVEVKTPTMRYTLDMSKTNTLDSAALGMLLIFQKEVEGSRERLKIINASPVILNILEIATFGKWFQFG